MFCDRGQTHQRKKGTFFYGFRTKRTRGVLQSAPWHSVPKSKWGLWQTNPWDGNGIFTVPIDGWLIFVWENFGQIYQSHGSSHKSTVDGKHLAKTSLRQFQQTPGTYPEPLTTCSWRESFICMDFTGICSMGLYRNLLLRVGDWYLILLRGSSHDLDTWLITMVCFRSQDLGQPSPSKWRFHGL